MDRQGRSTDPCDRRAAHRDRAPVRPFRQFSEGGRQVRRKARRATPSKSLECDLQGLLHDFQPWDCLQRRLRSGQTWSRNPLHDDRPDRRSIPCQVRGPAPPARYGYPALRPNAPQLSRERQRSESVPERGSPTRIRRAQRSEEALKWPPPAPLQLCWTSLPFRTFTLRGARRH